MPYKPTKVRTSRSNQPEMHLISTVAALGFRATKRGWPDFLCFHEETGEIIAIEVKPRLVTGDGMKILKKDQAACMDFLTAHGIRCFVSDGETLEPYMKEVHAPAWRRRRKDIRPHSLIG